MLEAGRIETKGQSRRHQPQEGKEKPRIRHRYGQGRHHAEMTEGQEPQGCDDEGPDRNRQRFIFGQRIMAEDGIKGIAETAPQAGHDDRGLDKAPCAA